METKEDNLENATLKKKNLWAVVSMFSTSLWIHIRSLFSALRFATRHFGKIFFGIIIVAASVVLLYAPASFALGNVFFGGKPSLYNLPLAQFLFLRAAYPYVGETPPHYAHHQLSRTYFIKGELKQAADEAERELAIYPDDTRTYYVLGLTYGFMNREEDAIVAFSKYIQIYPWSWPARNDKAWLQFRIGDINGALETIEPIAQYFRYTVWVQNTYCALLINKNRYEDAELACQYAKEAADKMTEADWGRSYPGNDPRIYGTGLRAMKMSIEQNMMLIRQNLEMPK